MIANTYSSAPATLARPGAWPHLQRRCDVAKRTCSVPGCDSRHYGRGWCQKHWARWRDHGDPNGSVWGDVEARIRAKTVESDDCWLYTGQPSARYPETRIDGRRIGIHRWSYTHHHGPIPDGHHVDHQCRNTHCWNPAHLRTLTALDNSADNIRANRFCAQTHCVNGHLLDEANVYRPPSQPSRRMCRTCRAERKSA